MSRALTRRRHGRYRSFDRLRRAESDAQAFITVETARLNCLEGEQGIHDVMHLALGDPGPVFTHELVQTATSCPDIGLTDVGDGFAMELGIGETFRSNQSDLNSGPEFTVSLWVKPDAVNVSGTMFDTPATFFGSRVIFDCRGAASSGRLGIILTDGGATQRQNKEYDGVLAAGVWVYLTISIEDSPFRQRTYINGVETAPTTIINDSAFGSGGQDREVFIGSNGSGGGTDQFPARYHSAAWWAEELTPPEVLETFNGGDGKAFDMLVDSGNYASSDNLQHWWRLGLNGILGKDFGITPVDILGFIGVDASDIVEDAPV
ncbi:MAG: LamG-like jellyroll fold domain-containing protein [Gemmatimonadota bacterium]